MVVLVEEGEGGGVTGRCGRGGESVGLCFGGASFFCWRCQGVEISFRIDSLAKLLSRTSVLSTYHLASHLTGLLLRISSLLIRIKRLKAWLPDLAISSAPFFYGLLNSLGAGY